MAPRSDRELSSFSSVDSDRVQVRQHSAPNTLYLHPRLCIAADISALPECCSRIGLLEALEAFSGVLHDFQDGQVEDKDVAPECENAFPEVDPELGVYAKTLYQDLMCSRDGI
eukprot:5011142-Amphidinium_carterae.3